MANLFANLADETKDMEKTTDRVGGGEGFIKESGIYNAVVKAAYVVKSQSSQAQGIGLILTLDDGTEYRETMWITNKEGHPYRLTQNNKKIPLSGFSNIDDLCELVTEKPLSAQESEEKEIKLYNFETQKEEPTLAPVLTDLLNKKVLVAILKKRENKRVKSGDTYVDSSEEKFSNSIEKFFHPDYKCTFVEARDKLEFGTFLGKWEAKWKDQVKDDYKEVANAPKTASVTGSQKVHSSLFDK